jgi:hypothetical protein
LIKSRINFVEGMVVIDKPAFFSLRLIQYPFLVFSFYCRCLEVLKNAF